MSLGKTIKHLWACSELRGRIKFGVRPQPKDEDELKSILSAAVDLKIKDMGFIDVKSDISKRGFH